MSTLTKELKVKITADANGLKGALNGISKDISQDYFEKYQDYYIELTLAKVQLEAYLKTQINEPLINWSLDFFTSEVSIND